MKKYLPLTIIIVASMITHFLFFGQPRETVFDEVHFGKFISGYFTHEYFFDIHPPLAKLMLSGAGYITGFEPSFSFAQIGQQFPDKHYLWLRLLPVIAGTLLPIVIFFLILQLGMSRLAAFVGGMLIVLENAILTQSRFILLDAFLLLFGFAALLFYFAYSNSAHNVRHSMSNMSYGWPYLFLSGLFGALAVSVKWTGGSFLLIIAVLYFINCLKSSQKTKSLILGFIFFVIIPLTIYFSIFAIHFSLLHKSGQGDAFMTPRFRKTLTGSIDSNNPSIKPLNIVQKFVELNFQMYRSNATLTATHPYSSQWYTWPFMVRPIYYWYSSAGPEQSSRIYFMGNPIIWWASTIAILFIILNALGEVLKGLWPKPNIVLFTGAYLLNMLPFVGIKRAMFLYHYMLGLVFAIIVLVYAIDRLSNKKRVFAILLAASFAAFVFFAPLSYGLPLTEKAYHLRNWLKTWI